ncbi:MAG: MoxR family ATPase, partial [Dehalococcoidia bacterium]
ATPDDVIKLQDAAKSVYVDSAVREYIVTLIEATRNHEDVSLGASPRASLGMFRAVRGLAILRERDYVIPDDVQELAHAVLAHRLILSSAARMRGLQTRQVIDGLLQSVAVPGATR